MTLRMNLHPLPGAPQSLEGVLPLDAQTHWYFPADESVDLAAIPLSLDQSKVDFVPFPVSLFATRDVIKSSSIAEGDAVLFAGFFYQFPGQKMIEPIVRQGILAMIPDENLTTTLDKPGHLYLADAHVFGGNSGSPMWVNVEGFRGGAIVGGGFPYRLLGVVSGYFYESSDFKLQVATTVSGTSNANSGISLVVPADDLKALLDTQELQRMRDLAVAQLTK